MLLHTKIVGRALAGIPGKLWPSWPGLLLALACWHADAGAQVSIEIDSALVVEAIGPIVLELEGDWTNNGTFDPGDSSTVIFFGNTPSTITNPNGETFNNLTIDKPGAALVLNSSVTVTDTLRLINGQVDNSNFPVFLAEGATVVVEGGSFASPPLIGTVPEFVLLSEKEIKIEGQVSSDGAIHSNDKIDFKKGNSGIHTGNLTAVNEITLDNTIDGDVTSGNKVELKKNAVVTGTVTEYAAVAHEPLSSLSFASGGANVTVAKAQSKTLAPGSFGKIKVEKKATLQLSTGEYFFEELDLKEKTILSLDITAGPVTINAEEKLLFHKKAQVVIVSPFGSATTFVTFNSLNKVDVHKGSVVLGTINSNDKVQLHKDVFFKGAIYANEIGIDKDCTFLHHTSGATLPSVAPALASGENVLQKSAAAGTVGLPAEFHLGQNYPNPFNPSTTITFAVPKPGEVTLAVYNILGQLMQTLHSGPIVAGRHSIVWDGTDFRGNPVASGVYVYRLQAKGFVTTRKLVLAK